MVGWCPVVRGQIIIPHKSRSYTDGEKEAPEKTIPMCTLRNFPSTIEHCIEWSRDVFHRWFVQPFTQALKIVKDPVEFARSVRAELDTYKRRGEKVCVR